MFLERIKTTELTVGKKYDFVVPMGATEQHGPFLPMGTDSFIQDAIIVQVEKTLPNVIFLPTLRITCSDEHKGFPGSVWIKLDTMNVVLRDICASLQPYAHTITFISWHGGNVNLLKNFVNQNGSSFANVVIAHLEYNSKEVIDKIEALLGGSIDAHAGNSEIAMMLKCNESLVLVPSASYPKQKIDSPWGTGCLADVSRDGIADNNPAWIFSKEIGEKCIEFAAEELRDGLLLQQRNG